MKKQALSLVLALTMCLGLAVPAQASNGVPSIGCTSIEAVVAEDKRTVTLPLPDFTGTVTLSNAATDVSYGSDGSMDPVVLCEVPAGTVITLELPDGVAVKDLMQGKWTPLADGAEVSAYLQRIEMATDRNGYDVLEEYTDSSFTLNAGELAFIQLYYLKNDDDSPVYDRSPIQFRASGTPASDPVVPETPTGLSASPTFTDVSPDAYYADAVAWAIERGITKGTSNTTFSPDVTCTQAQILTFLWRAYGMEEPTIDPSTINYLHLDESSYYYKAALWACEKSLFSGYFDFDAPCERQDVILYLWILAGNPRVSDNMPFTDIPAGMALYVATSWAVTEGIANGTSKTTFSPEQTCTRGQIATFLYRALAK